MSQEQHTTPRQRFTVKLPVTMTREPYEPPEFHDADGNYIPFADILRALNDPEALRSEIRQPERAVPFYACEHGTPGGCGFCNATAPQSAERPNAAESPVFLPRAIALLNTVKAWRDCDGNDGFPHDVREQIDALLMAYELREQEKRRG